MLPGAGNTVFATSSPATVPSPDCAVPLLLSQARGTGHCIAHPCSSLLPQPYTCPGFALIQHSVCRGGMVRVGSGTGLECASETSQTECISQGWVTASQTLRAHPLPA